MSKPTNPMRRRVQEIVTDYWDARDSGKSERVCIALLALAIAKAEMRAEEVQLESEAAS